MKYLCDKSKEIRDYLPESENCRCEDNVILQFQKEFQELSKCDTCLRFDAYIRELRVRILKTLEAHLTWTKSKRKQRISVVPHSQGRPGVEGCDSTVVWTRDLSVTNIWITGEEIDGRKSQGCLSSASLTDIPFEIIKFHSFHRFYKANKDSLTVVEKKIEKDVDKQEALDGHLGSSISLWLQKLHESDKRCHYTFNRVRKDGAKTYHLADHVWICRAIKCAEELNLDNHLKLPDDLPYLEYLQCEEKENQHQAGDLESEEAVKKCWSAELQRIILKRFTTRNP